MDFFKTQCQSGPYTQERFGVCDDPVDQPAYVDTTLANKNKWIATVSNPKQIPVTFTAIDKCVIQDKDEPGRGRCDAMLTTDQLLYFIELKNKKPPWQESAHSQLESTIQFLLAAHPEEIKQYPHKKAFACNRKRPAFVESNPELKRRFFEYGFRVHTQATVVVVS